MKNEKINYFALKFEQFTGDCKNTSKQINNIIDKRNINNINENDFTHETKHDIDNVVNNSYFVNDFTHETKHDIDNVVNNSYLVEFLKKQI